MVLQIGGGNLRADRPLHGAGDDGSLMLAKGDDHDAAGLQDRFHAHGDGGARNLLLALKIPDRIAAREPVEMDETCHAAAG